MLSHVLFKLSSVAIHLIILNTFTELENHRVSDKSILKECSIELADIAQLGPKFCPRVTWEMRERKTAQKISQSGKYILTGQFLQIQTDRNRQAV